MRHNYLDIVEGLVPKVLSILTSVDAQGLIRIGAPKDEYISEAKTIAFDMVSGRYVDAEYIRDVFLVWFATGKTEDNFTTIGKMPMRDDFGLIARRINEEIVVTIEGSIGWEIKLGREPRSPADVFRHPPTFSSTKPATRGKQAKGEKQ